MALNVSVVGASGYTGLELIKLLYNHPEFCLKGVFNSEGDTTLDKLHPSLFEVLELQVQKASEKEIAKVSDLVFLALPHQKAMEMAKNLLELGVKVVDLSADYRLSVESYEKYYCTHKDKKNLPQAVYGLVEYAREKVKNTNLVANPGCYPTATLLALLPFVSYIDTSSTIYIDAKSGVSGAGKKLSPTSHFATINENLFAYNPIAHRHSPEIYEHLEEFGGIKLKTLFVPHLVPITRGMLVSIYARLKEEINPLEVLCRRYEKEEFIRIRKNCVEIKNVSGTHFCDIYAKSDGLDLFINSSIDNLLRGASSQALANANLMCHLPENLGLPKVAYVP